MDQEQLIAMINQLEKQVKELQSQRINQQMILPNAVRQGNIFGGKIIFVGLDKNLPTNGSTEVQFYFAQDTLKLYAWSGTAWKSTTLS